MNADDLRWQRILFLPVTGVNVRLPQYLGGVVLDLVVDIPTHAKSNLKVVFLPAERIVFSTV